MPAPAPMNGEEPRLGDVQNLCTPLDPRLTFETFVIGKPNEFAHAAALRVAEADEIPFNPLFLYGSVGLGKTHLMHAIAWRLKMRNPQRRVMFLSSETFMHLFVKAVRYKDTHAFKEQFRSVDVLMIDDVQFINGKESTQEEFFHTFNALVDSNRQVIVSADKSPSDLEDMEERLRSRLGWGLVADIHATTYELRLGILQAKADLQRTAVPEEVLKFLAGDRDVQRYYFQEGGNLPTVANGVELMPELAVLPDAEIIATEPSFTEPRYPWAASDPRWSLQAALQAAIAGTLTPEQALAQAQAETDAWLASQ